MNIQILHRITKAVLFSKDSESIKECLLAALASNADLCDADLRGADLRGADLCDADLRGADLRGANLRDANLCDANLCDADLRDANLRDTDLRDADLRDANLRDADLCSADLCSAKLSELQSARMSIVPDGDIIGWKSCCDGVIVKLLIPKEAKRSNSTGRKCRAEFADVLEVIGARVGYSKMPSAGERLEYRKGERVKCVKPFDDCRWNECSTGIHFYITREEAEND